MERMRATYVSERVHDGIFGAVTAQESTFSCLAEALSFIADAAPCVGFEFKCAAQPRAVKTQRAVQVQ